MLIELLFLALIATYYIVSRRTHYWESFRIFGYENSKTPLMFRRFRILYILAPKLLFIASLMSGFFLNWHFVVGIIVCLAAFLFASRQGIRLATGEYRSILEGLLQKDSQREDLKKLLAHSDKELYQLELRRFKEGIELQNAINSMK